MAFTTTQLSALEQAIGTGQLSIAYDGKTVTYRSTGDLLKAYNFVKDQLTANGALVEPGGTNRGPSALTIFSRD